MHEQEQRLQCTHCQTHWQIESNGTVDLTAALAADESVQRAQFDVLTVGREATADPYHSFVTPGGLRFRGMLHRLGLREGLRFLEVGCGAGPLCDSLSSNTGALGFGIDISTASVAGQLTRRGNRSGYDVVTASATELPFHDALFDVVLCTDLVEHLANPAAFYAEASRVLKPGGRLLIRCNVLDFGLTFDWLRYKLARKRWLAKMADLGHYYENFKTRAQHRTMAETAALKLELRRGFDIFFDNILEYHLLPALFALRGGHTTAPASAEPPEDGVRLRVPNDLPHRAARLLSRVLYGMLWPEYLLGRLGFGASEWMLFRKTLGADRLTQRAAT